MEMVPTVSLFGLVSALTNGLVQVLLLLVKERKHQNGSNGRSDSLTTEIRFEMVQNGISEVKNDIARLESSVGKVNDRAENIERSLLTLSVGGRR